MVNENKDVLLFIGGGMTFRDREQMLRYYSGLEAPTVYGGRWWSDWLAWSLEPQYESVHFARPLKDNADYDVWKIMFEKQVRSLQTKRLHIVAHSLGTIFIMKFLLENKDFFESNLISLHLVAPIVANEFQPKDSQEDTGTFTFDYSSVYRLTECCSSIHLWHSEDDTVCSIANSNFLASEIKNAVFHRLQDRGHVVQSTFWELFDYLRGEASL